MSHFQLENAPTNTPQMRQDARLAALLEQAVTNALDKREPLQVNLNAWNVFCVQLGVGVFWLALIGIPWLLFWVLLYRNG